MEPNDYARQGYMGYRTQQMLGGYLADYAVEGGTGYYPMNAGIYGQNPNSYLAAGSMGVPSAEAGDYHSESKMRGKRRSKNDVEGRDFKCTQCDKTYLSYPALYTHIKTKHAPGNDIAQASGRGRGRPKKNNVSVPKIGPSTPKYFEAEGRKGGPTEVLEGFQDAYNILYALSKNYGGFHKHPLYLELEKLHNNPTFVPPKQGEEEASSSKENVKQPEGENKFNEEPVPKKKEKKCDQIFAEYLETVAAVTNAEYYKLVVQIIFLFRECMNHYGNRLLSLKEPKPESNNSEENSESKKVEEAKIEEEYCLKYDTEQAPEVTNEFVTSYIDQIRPTLEKKMIIDLTQNLCTWLYTNNYTAAKLSLIQDNPQRQCQQYYIQTGIAKEEKKLTGKKAKKRKEFYHLLWGDKTPLVTKNPLTL